MCIDASGISCPSSQRFLRHAFTCKSTRIFSSGTRQCHRYSICHMEMTFIYWQMDGEAPKSALPKQSDTDRFRHPSSRAHEASSFTSPRCHLLSRHHPYRSPSLLEIPSHTGITLILLLRLTLRSRFFESSHSIAKSYKKYQIECFIDQDQNS